MAEKKTEKLDGLSGKKVRLTIQKSPDKFAVDPVPVSINGFQYTIRRGEEVIVPVEVVEVLENAKEVQYEQIHNPDQSTTMVAREVPSYPFSAYAV